MQVFRSIEEVPADFGPSVLTIGKFDGVHIGHRAVIERVRTTARARGLMSVVLTFDRNPLAVLRPDVCPPELISAAQKLELLAETDPDATLMLTFDEEFSKLRADEFPARILKNALNAAVVLVGSDFRFGAGGSGDVDLLREHGALHGFEVIQIDDVPGHGAARRASSTWIRELLSEGRVAEAAKLLGSLPTIRGTVVHGQARGRVLGYPTANLSREVEGFVPGDGVYAAWLTARGIRYPAAVSVGNNPTFGDVPEKQVEAHAIDANFDIYDDMIEISFVDFVRPMHKFPGTDELAQQMGRDEEQIRRILGVP